MTEAEATTKWCPQSVCSRDPEFEPSQNCVGSRCMAWRWSLRLPRHAEFIQADGVFNRGDQEPARRPDNVPASWDWVVIENTGMAGWQGPKPASSGMDQGYCGLAGAAVPRP